MARLGVGSEVPPNHHGHVQWYLLGGGAQVPCICSVVLAENGNTGNGKIGSGTTGNGNTGHGNTGIDKERC